MAPPSNATSTTAPANPRQTVPSDGWATPEASKSVDAAARGNAHKPTTLSSQAPSFSPCGRNSAEPAPLTTMWRQTAQAWKNITAAITIKKTSNINVGSGERGDSGPLRARTIADALSPLPTKASTCRTNSAEEKVGKIAYNRRGSPRIVSNISTPKALTATNSAAKSRLEPAEASTLRRKMSSWVSTSVCPLTRTTSTAVASDRRRLSVVLPEKTLHRSTSFSPGTLVVQPSHSFCSPVSDPAVVATSVLFWNIRTLIEPGSESEAHMGQNATISAKSPAAAGSVRQMNRLTNAVGDQAQAPMLVFKSCTPTGTLFCASMTTTGVSWEPSALLTLTASARKPLFSERLRLLTPSCRGQTASVASSGRRPTSTPEPNPNEPPSDGLGIRCATTLNRPSLPAGLKQRMWSVDSPHSPSSFIEDEMDWDLWKKPEVVKQLPSARRRAMSCSFLRGAATAKPPVWLTEDTSSLRVLSPSTLFLSRSNCDAIKMGFNTRITYV
mmetsp:Transcript_49772/g.131965  ORF Transcript_49772/g.131965 Transcript_49772/m.131965 type:complete len:499 (+) Transcript_49772:1769-3265(+)